MLLHDGRAKNACLEAAYGQEKLDLEQLSASLGKIVATLRERLLRYGYSLVPDSTMLCIAARRLPACWAEQLAIQQNRPGGSQSEPAGAAEVVNWFNVHAC